MRLRTLFAITLTMFALPAFAVGQRDDDWKPEGKPVSAEALVSIADVQLDAAFDEKTAPENKERLLDAARKGYQKALQQEPKSKAALRGMAQFHARLGEREKSVEMYKKYLTLYPKDAEVAHEVATAHARWKDWTGAVAWCEFALKIDPESRSVKKTLGFCQARAGKWDEAIATLCLVMPEADARFNLAGMLNHMGHTHRAKEQLSLALKVDPAHVPARDLMRELESVAVMPAPRELPAEAAPANKTVAYKYKLRYVGAADAAQAVNAFLTGQRLPARVTAEAEFNNVVVSAEPELQKQIGDILAKLDKAPVQVLVQAMVLEVPRGSAITQWLADDGKPGASSWTLTPREVKSLTTLIREAKGRGELDILARPQLQVAENQTGSVRVGQSFPVVTAGEWKKNADGAVVLEPKTIEYLPTGCSMKITPRVSPDGSVLLRTEAQYTWVLRDAVTLQSEGGEAAIKVPAFNTQSVNSTVAVRDGETLVLGMEGGSAPTASSFFGAARQHFAGEQRVMLVVLTPHIVRNEADNARVLAEEAAKPPMPNAVEPCFPERYNHAARQAVIAPFAQQVNNGHYLTQTVWNYHFEAGTDKLTPAGLKKLDSLARTRPAPDPKVYIQTARDLTAPVGTLADLRTDLDAKRAAAVQKYLAAQPAIGAPIAYEVYVHDAAVPSAETPASASQGGAGGAVRPAGGSPK